MDTLKFGSTGASVQLLQTAINRAGYGAIATSGTFDDSTKNALISFQKSKNIPQDGVFGAQTYTAMLPYFLGYITHKAVQGDTYYSLAQKYSSSLRAIETANPSIDATNLKIGDSLIIPLPFDVIPTDISYSSSLIAYCVRGLISRYPFLKFGEMGRSVMGKPLYYLTCGTGENPVFFGASYHANEWITTPVLLKFTEDLCRAYMENTEIEGISAEEILEKSIIYIAPAINPDAIDLVTYDLKNGAYYNSAVAIAENYPDVPFPEGWKANISGVDLNLQFPAEWEKARQIKFAQGYVSPAPRDYVGTAPISARESLAVYNFTREIKPNIALAYHSQGEVIFWKYLDFEPENSREIVEILSGQSGYPAIDTPYNSSFAGYKDWVIAEYNKPAYTIEIGLGTNPLPIEQFPKIYADNKKMLTTATIITAV